MVIAAMCILLVGNGYSKEKNIIFPSEYPPEWGVAFKQANLLDSKAKWCFWDYPGFKPGTTILKKGTVYHEGGIALPIDIQWDRDVAVTLRDGKNIYVDIFRPVGGSNLPAILAYAPYGKQVPQDPTYTFMKLVPPDRVSGINTFEGPDPAFWCKHGYAVINVDQRGAFMSEGDIHYWGMVDAADGYDVVEWAAKQKWCNGKVGMAGNSWLAIVQWYIAALNPPHLAAIAPWNGLSDMYRQDVVWGGIPNPFFNKFITDSAIGNNRAEQPYEMVNKCPLLHPYWEDKAAKLEKIKVPAYVVVDASGSLHRMGAFEGFRRMSSKNKWLRVNNTQEWYDLYVPENSEDLRKFFDRYLKGIKNDWEKTPGVRMAVLDPGGVDQVNIPESRWPLVGTEYRKFYLDAAAGTLSHHAVTKASSMTYDAKTGQATFTIRFEQDTYVIGYPKLRLWVEAEGADDMDLFVLMQKLDANGNHLIATPAFTPKYEGNPGRLRVSLRELDPKLSTSFLPVQSFKKQEKLSPGQIVPVDIAIWPQGMMWHKGEQLRLIVAGNKLAGFVQAVNAGNHIIHTGLKHESYLQLPIIPTP